MPEEKTENRFIKFFQRNKKLFLPFRYFVYLVGIVVIILFILDFALRIFLKEDFLEESPWNSSEVFYYEPYLDFGCSYRETKNPCKNISKDPLLIYTFGGSTMWGVKARYDETIASYISELLCEEKIPVEVRNLGIQAYVSTQEVIKLFLELADSNVPDIVIFYDGANDVGGRGHVYKTPQAFKYFAHKMSDHKGAFSNLKIYFDRSFTDIDSYSDFEDDILDGYFSKFKSRTAGLEGKELYVKVMEIYINNVKIVKSMEKDWGFKSFFYWQPTLYDKRNNLSDEEVFLREYSELFGMADPIVTEFLGNAEHIRDLRGIFIHRSDTVFTDWCHILPENNKIIAENIVEDIIKYLKEEGYYEEK